MIRELNYPGGVPQPPAGRDGKHYRWIYDSKRQVVVECGGDDARAIGTNPNGSIRISDGSFVNGLWSYKIATDEWANIYPYCGFDGELAPGRPDEVGWVYDSLRDRYLVLPGFFGLQQSGPGICGSSASWTAKILAFDPVINKWSDPGIPKEPVPAGEENSKNGVYDAATDSVWRVRHSGGGGIMWDVLKLSTKTWSSFQTPFSTQGLYINSAHLDKEQLALDQAKRHIYVIDPNFHRLFRLDMATKKITVLASPPKIDPSRPGTLQDITMVAWDSINHVLFYPYNHDHNCYPFLTTILIYHPDTNKWEVGPKCRGNSCVFNEATAELLLYASTANPTGSTPIPKSTKFYLYRYDAGLPIPGKPINLRRIANG